MTGFLPSPRHRSIAILLTAAVLAGCAGKSDTPGRVKKAEKTPSAGSAAQNVSGTARQLTFSAGDQASPAFFPDGKSLIFQNNSDGNWELYTLDLAGGDPRRLTDSPENEENPSVSPDGRWILCTVYPPALDADPARDIMLLSKDGKTRILLVSGPSDDWYPRFSPDGSQVYFVSDRTDSRTSLNDAERRSAIFRVPREGGQPEQLTAGDDETAPLPMADGSLVFRDGQKHWKRLDALGNTSELYAGDWIFGMPAAGLAGDFWLSGSENLDSSSRIVHTAPGFSPLTPLDLSNRQEDRGPNVSPDGKSLVFYGRVSGQWDLFLIPING